MTAHLFEHKQDITLFKFRKRNVIECCLIDNVALRSGNADGQVLRQKNLAPSHCKRVLNGVLQFSDIARPCVRHQNAHRPIRKTAWRLAVLLGELLQEMQDEKRNIFTPVLQVGQAHGYDVQAVEQILSKLAAFRCFFEVLIAGRHKPNIDLNVLTPAHPPYNTFLQHPQQLHLKTRGKRVDLVQEYGAPLRFLDQTPPRLVRAGERSLLMAEQLGLKQSVWNCRTVYGHKRRVAAIRVIVNRTRDQFLPSSSRSSYQGGGISAGRYSLY